MSRHSRQKRTSKQKSHRRASSRRERWNPDPEDDRAAVLDNLVTGLYRCAMCPAHDADFHAAELLAGSSSRTDDLAIAADCAMSGAISHAWQVGWTPNDLHEYARRTLDAAAAGYLDAAIVLESRQYAVATLHPRWRAELAALPTAPSTPQLWDWAVRHDIDRHAVLATVLTVLRLLGTLPVLEKMLPLPGADQYADTAVDDADAKALARVRGLLAKAEATQFPEEAEALSAKAQELMSRYSLHHAMRAHEHGRAPDADARRLWIDSPYVIAKSTLVQVVAAANRCRIVCSAKIGFVSVVGADCDLDLVELLATSLLVQANRGMLAAGRHFAGGHTRTRSFRQSFLLAYANRIGERLADTMSTVAAEVNRDKLLPVLAARSRATDELTDRLFPRVVERTVSGTNGAGTTAGRIAADLAQLEVRRPLAG